MRPGLAFLLLLLGTLQGAEGTELEPIEFRGHKTIREALERMSVDETWEAFKDELLAGDAEATEIMRSWYRRLPEDGRWSSEGLVKLENIVLVDLEVDNLRFMWKRTADFSSGERHYVLTFWWGAQRKETMEVDVEYEDFGSHDLGTFVEAGRTARDKGELGRSEEVLLDFTLGGREWTTTLDAWEQGELLPEDRRLLDEALDGQLVDMLELVDAIAPTIPTLNELCSLVTRPLLGGSESCMPTEEPFLILGSKPACSFDAWFGEPCSPSQTAESNLREQPELAATGSSPE